MDLQLQGLVALVTGASQGLGYATALQLAREGAIVAINSRDPIKLAAAARKIADKTSVNVLALPGDVTDPDLAGDLMTAVTETLGGLDILVANAGGPPAGSFESMDDAAWQRAFELNFLSQVRLIRAAVPYLRQSLAASVLTVTSASVKQPILNLVLSNSIRAATVGLTKTLSQELGAEGIRFNSIMPGWTQTDRVVDLLTQRAQKNGTTLEIEMTKQVKEIPLGRMGTPEEFANAAAFLVSPAAGYITGVMLPVDGGLIRSTL